MTIRPGALQPDRDRLAIAEPRVARLLDAGEQEHAVVRGQPERDREQQHGLAGLQRTLALVGEQPLEPAVLEDQHEQPERGGEREHVHHQRLHREHDRARHGEQDDQRRDGEDRERERQVRAQRRLLVHERRRLPADVDGNGARAPRTSPTSALADSDRSVPRGYTSIRHSPRAWTGRDTAATPSSPRSSRANAATSARCSGPACAATIERRRAAGREVACAARRRPPARSGRAAAPRRRPR